MVKKLRGVIIPMVTPFLEDETLARDMLAFNIERWNRTAVGGYMCLGSNGEFRSLDDEESLTVLSDTLEHRAPDKTVICGVSREALIKTLRFLEQIEKRGLNPDYVSVQPPHYFKQQLDEATLIRYYTAVADASPWPVLLYGAPGYTNGVSLSVEMVQTLADHPNIYGIKDSSSNMMIAYLAALGPRKDFTVISGTLNNIISCLAGGGTCGIISSSNYLPEQCAELFSRYETEGGAAVLPYFMQLRKLTAATGSSAGVASVKCCMDLLGYKGGAPRLPLPPIDAKTKEKFRKLFQEDDLCLM